MAKVPLARRGIPLMILTAPVEFSYFPTRKGDRRAGLQSKVYTTDPWSVIKSAIRQDCPEHERADASAFAAQAEEFYRAAANAQTPHGRPLLLYYSFLNLAKALCLHRGNNRVLGYVGHGLRDKNVDSAVAIDEAVVEGFPSTSGHPQIFHEFMSSALNLGLAATTTYSIRDVLASSLVGHRLWTEAASASDRFLRVDVKILHGNASGTLWLRAGIPRGSLKRRGLNQSEVTSLGFGKGWRAVSRSKPKSKPKSAMIFWEQVSPIKYRGRPSDDLDALIATARLVFYRSLTIAEPFRHYYVYVRPDGYEKHHQLASRYILLFFLGSVTRYHPADFSKYLDGKYGPFLAEFLASEPGQMLFEMACLFLKREVVSVGLA
jgi:hypothetical protein